jgi:hypothetical protein
MQEEEGMPSSFAHDQGSKGIKPLPNLRFGGSQLAGVRIPFQWVT